MVCLLCCFWDCCEAAHHEGSIWRRKMHTSWWLGSERERGRGMDVIRLPSTRLHHLQIPPPLDLGTNPLVHGPLKDAHSNYSGP